MNNLHVAIIEDFEECLVSNTELGLRNQVIDALAEKSITPPSDEEWSDCVKADDDYRIPTENPSLSLISYYKIESRIGIKPAVRH